MSFVTQNSSLQITRYWFKFNALGLVYGCSTSQGNAVVHVFGKFNRFSTGILRTPGVRLASDTDRPS